MAEDVIPIERWGRDHWSTLAYVETRIVDHGGRLDLNHMRAHPRVHRAFANAASREADTASPTRLNDDTTVDRHDDWSCVEDAVALGLLTMDEQEPIQRRRADEGGAFSKARSPRFVLTDLGRDVANQLRAHKGNGGSFATFRPTLPSALATAEAP